MRMKRIFLPDVLDTLFYTVAAWFLALGLLRYFRIPTGISLAVCTLLSVAVGLCSALLLSRSRTKKRLTKEEREERDRLLLHLALEKEERVRSSLLQAFLADGKRANCEEEGIRTEDALVLPLFTMQPLSADSAALLLRRHGSEEFTLACNSLTPEAEKLLFSFGKKTLRGDEVYALFKRTGTIPSPLICGELPRRSARETVRRAFSKQNARPFFVSGLLLLWMSLFSFFPLYYLISGSVLLAVSVFVRAIGYAR